MCSVKLGRRYPVDYNVTPAAAHMTSSKRFVVDPSQSLTGEMSVPGDKSMSHRSMMFGAIAQGVTEVSGFLEGEDSLHTSDAFTAIQIPSRRSSVKNSSGGKSLFNF